MFRELRPGEFKKKKNQGGVHQLFSCNSIWPQGLWTRVLLEAVQGWHPFKVEHTAAGHPCRSVSVWDRGDLCARLWLCGIVYNISSPVVMACLCIVLQGFDLDDSMMNLSVFSVFQQVTVLQYLKFCMWKLGINIASNSHRAEES